MHRLFPPKLLAALLACLTLSLSAHPHHGEMPENARPQTVRIEFSLSLSVDEKAAVLAEMEKQFPGVKHLSTSLNPKANFRELRIPPDWSINQALSELKKVEGVVTGERAPQAIDRILEADYCKQRQTMKAPG